MSRSAYIALSTLALAACNAPVDSTIPESESQALPQDEPDTLTAKKGIELVEVPSTSNARPISKNLSIVVATHPSSITADGTVSGAAAAATGRLQMSGSCLTIELGNGALIQPVFPAGTASWDAIGGELTYNGDRYKIGSSITVGGGGIADDEKFHANPEVKIPACVGARLFIVAG